MLFRKMDESMEHYDKKINQTHKANNCTNKFLMEAIIN